MTEAKAAAERFCKVPSDAELIEHYPTLEVLIADFQPGNYAPTNEQAMQLVDCAARAAVRWQVLRAADHVEELLGEAEWEEQTVNGQHLCRWKTPFTTYQAFHWLRTGNFGWRHDGSCVENCRSLDEAKAACWSDYVSRMRKAFKGAK